MYVRHVDIYKNLLACGVLVEHGVAIVPVGWLQIVDTLCQELLKLGWDGDIRYIKEKFGSLRIEIGVATIAMQTLVLAAEIESSHTCVTCAAKDAKVRSKYPIHQLTTLCPLCA